MQSSKKNKGGRPTKYNPIYCDQAIEFMGQGYSLTAFAGSIDVSRDTVYEWQSKHVEFSDAIKMARAKGQMRWEERLRDQAISNSGNTGAIAFAMKNLYADDWREKQEIEHKVSTDLADLLDARRNKTQSG